MLVHDNYEVAQLIRLKKKKSSSALIGYSIEMDFRWVIPFMFRKNGAPQEAVEEGLNFFKSTALAESPLSYPDIGVGYIMRGSPPMFMLFSLALFAFWLRSSVVSVLFSLISEILLREKSMIKFIFVTGEGSSGLAYDPSHCVPGLTLPPGDANSFSSTFSACLGH